MIRKIIQIDEDKCIGCSLCATACHEGAIQMVNGKAKLMRDDYCDGLGDCLPVCPTDAISFVEREALAYNEAAVLKAKKEKNQPYKLESELTNWPIQLKLVSANASFLNNCDLVIAADCTAFTYANFHQDFIKDKKVIIGCPKLDNEDYSHKLGLIFQNNNIKSITLVRMEVPCCGGITNMVRKAMLYSGKNIPVKVIIITTNGEILAV